MKIKRFVAADMRSAMNLVRKEHGPDAVILSNRRIEEGVEIVAAAHYDESVVQRALETARKDSAPAPAPAPRPRTAADAMIAAMTRRRTPEQDVEPVAATTSAVAALARAAVGATGRTLNSADEGVPRRGSEGFAATLARAAGGLARFPSPPAVNEPSLPEQIFAPFVQPPADAPRVSPSRPAAALPRAWVEDETFEVAAAAEAVEPRVPAPVLRAPAVLPPPLPMAFAAQVPELSDREPQQAAVSAVGSAEPCSAESARPRPASLADHGSALPLAVSAEPCPAESAPAPTLQLAEVVPPAPPVVAPPTLTVIARDDEEMRHLRNEVAGMRQVIEREMHRFTDERLRGNPVRATALDLMDEYGFDAGIARDVVLQIPLDTEAHRGRGLMLGLLSRKLPISPVDPLEAGGVIALVGPTGAGKTTTIAKLASRFAEAHAPRDVALVTTDTARIGAREQLYGFGRQLGIAVHEANSGTDLDQLLERLKDYKLVLIDTAGVGPRDRTLASQLQWLRAAPQVSTLLVLPANTSFGDMDEVVRRFSAANLQGVVLSKLDETGRFGTALSVAVDHRLPITWVTDGQDVPEDLHRASAANLVLRLEDLRRAADMPCNPELNHAVA
ncbi:flagellar biosynthesis protein FlhF [Stenotrophomonas sp. Betaine-02u-21]|uniref:flagellar biosynthesis protein FlhF n=1 Tax=unclassified Stenotrophomonas TaxID=196198 RepID=UPI000C33D62E|nr:MULTISPECIES: flagellar biosynthesis protein FlhF [unclassified Stenotrophomonas]PKH70342.1 flagellar biosynthesis protein FlhF [Stenotrophomonas sp. Betaine-02u-23]PKH74597.1 flagellar biosynthesis protein FlhF [Stenotrophomonas sp. Betaine-02u-21]PKH96172.1 flagellar biosynthesis protein FlhF [Stenotrophomonas sp. Bg11-02]